MKSIWDIGYKVVGDMIRCNFVIHGETTYKGPNRSATSY